MRPGRILIISAGGAAARGGTAAEAAGYAFLAGELAQAGVVYEKIAQVEVPIEFVDAAAGELGGACAPRPGDALIVLWNGSEKLDFLGGWGRGGAAILTCAYVVCPGAAEAARFESACRERDLAPSGALLVSNLGVAGRLTASPRMGFVRRPVSEACDRLLYAARMGEPANTQTARFRTLKSPASI